MQTKKERKPLYALLIEHREIPLLAVLVLLLIAISIRVPGYIPKSYMNVLKNGSVNMVMSCGMLCVLLILFAIIEMLTVLVMAGDSLLLRQSFLMSVFIDVLVVLFLSEVLHKLKIIDVDKE